MCQKYWFAYTGPDGSESSINNYTLLQVSPTSCVPGSRLCAIYVCTEPNSQPVIPVSTFFSNNIASYFASAKITNVPQPFGSKKYVYVRAT